MGKYVSSLWTLAFTSKLIFVIVLGHPLPPTILATLVSALHARPFQTFPMLFAPALLFSSYLNLAGYTVDAAGTTAAWSGLYLLLARRRKSKRVLSKFGARGLARGAAMGLAGVNVLGCGATYVFGKREEMDEKVV